MSGGGAMYDPSGAKFRGRHDPGITRRLIGSKEDRDSYKA